MAVINQPVGQSTAITKNLPSAPSGDQPPPPLSQKQGQGPCGIFRIGLTEVIHKRGNLGASPGDAIQLIEQGLEGLHGAG